MEGVGLNRGSGIRDQVKVAPLHSGGLGNRHQKRPYSGNAFPCLFIEAVVLNVSTPPSISLLTEIL